MEALLLTDQSISTYNRFGNRYASVNSFSFRGPGSNPASLFGIPSSLSSSSFHSLQPPLLPLPLARSPSLPSRNRSLPSSPSVNQRKNKKTKDQDVAPKKAKSTPKKASSRSAAMECFMNITPTTRLGPDPSDLPKEVPKALKSSSLQIQSLDGLDHSVSIFSLAPPPSSLPLPKFSLRPKTGCNAEAGGINAGATDNLRRLLRLPKPVLKTGS